MSNLPTLHIKAPSIPTAHYRAIKAVWEQGIDVATEYDRRDSQGNLIDPPSKDARVLIEVENLFAQPRFSPMQFCEIGKYYLEILGFKNQQVIPYHKLHDYPKDIGTLWPYTYNQRLTDYPSLARNTNQTEKIFKKLQKTPHTRRAVMTTACPEVDHDLAEDIPCLREVQFRIIDKEININTTWRSRDLFKAWSDNVLALSFWFETLFCDVDYGACFDEILKLGTYADYSMSLHIYGQDFIKVKGDGDTLAGFFEVFPTEDDYINKSMDSECARDLILGQMQGFLMEKELWKLSTIQIELIKNLMNSIEKQIIHV